MTSAPVNLKTLSNRLGLSQTTVSRALNGFPEVNEKTRIRVVETARELNYRPSPSAANLATGKANAIGHVVPLAEHKMINPHFSDFIAGAGEVYSRHGHDMLIRTVDAKDESAVYRDFSARKRVDGVVVHGPMTDDPRIDLLRSLKLPFVVHGRTDREESEYSCLDVNNIRAFTRATEFLVDLGHKKIALLNGLETMNFAKRRRTGYENGLIARGIPINPQWIFAEDMVEPYGYVRTNEMLASNNPPTAILTSSILVALGAARAISNRGLTIGKDVSIITFDDMLSFLQTSSSSPSTEIPFFTAMRSSIREAGGKVAEMLIDQINNPGQEPKRILWEAEFVIGKTTGPCTAL